MSQEQCFQVLHEYAELIKTEKDPQLKRAMWGTINSIVARLERCFDIIVCFNPTTGKWE